MQNGVDHDEWARTAGFQAGPYKTITDAEYATAGLIDWYNHRRLRGTLCHTNTLEHETAHYAIRNRHPQPV